MISVAFATAFDRTAGVRWQTDQRFDSDPESNTFVASSSDLVIFDWSWTLSKESGSGAAAWTAFKGSLGNTANMVGLVPALLMPTLDLKHIRLDPEALRVLSDAGDETVDGVTCSVIDAEGWTSQRVRLWIDRSGALRRFWTVRHIKAAFDIPASTVETDIHYAPEFGVEIRPEELRHAPLAPDH